MNAGFFEVDCDKVKTVCTDAEIAEERAVSEAGLGTSTKPRRHRTALRYVVMLSTVARCGSTTEYAAVSTHSFEAWARELAGRTRSGRFVEVDGPHTIFEGPVPEAMVEFNRLLDGVR